MASTVTDIIGPLRKENCCSDRSISLEEIPPTHSREEDALSGGLTHLWCAARSPHISGRRTSLPPGSCYTHIVPSPCHRWCLVGFGLRDSCILGKAPKQAIQLYMIKDSYTGKRFNISKTIYSRICVKKLRLSFPLQLES